MSLAVDRVDIHPIDLSYRNNPKAKGRAMDTKVEELEIVTIAGSDYTVSNWSGMDVLVSKKGTAYMIEPGVFQPVSFPGGTPLRKRGNPVYVMNVGGIIEEVKK